MKRVNETQYIDGIRILERSVLFPKKKSENEILKTDETITIHHMSASWLTERQKKRGTFSRTPLISNFFFNNLII